MFGQVIGEVFFLVTLRSLFACLFFAFGVYRLKDFKEPADIMSIQGFENFKFAFVIPLLWAL